MGAAIEVRTGIEYAVHDGQGLKGDWYAPKAPGAYPAIVAIHGGGWQMGASSSYQYWGPWLAARGYVVFSVTYRLSKPGKKSFPEALHDVRAAVQCLKGRAAELRVDPTRVAAMGDSAGGHLAALLALAGDDPMFAASQPAGPHSAISSKLKVVVPVYGVFDLYQQWLHDLPLRPRDSIVEKHLGVSAIDDKRAYFDASPLSWVSARNNATAFLVAWGTRDDIVDPATQSEAFLAALKQAGHFARPVVLEGAPHFWMSEPLDEAGSPGGFLAPRLLRFLEQRL